MIPDDLRDDPLLGALSGVPWPDPDPARAARVRARCRAALAPRRAPAAALAGALWRRVLEPAAIGAAAVYLAEVIRRAAALFGL